MRFLKLAMAAVVALGFGNAYAFHGGGVAECEGCHTMHEAPGAGFLLAAADQSSTCLLCHEHAGDTGPSSYHISTAAVDMTVGTPPDANSAIPPKQLTPGGDFGWLRLGFSNSYVTSAPDKHGHNIVATGNGYNAIPGVAPGGTFQDNTFGCHSCHDPHGKYRRTTDSAVTYTTGGKAIQKSGSYNTSTLPVNGEAVGAYRILAGANYAPVSNSNFPFTAPPPNAAAPSSYNRTEAVDQTAVAYGSGMSEWCANCHTDFVGQMSAASISHPAGNDASMAQQYLGTDAWGATTIWQNYNAYVKSGDMTGTVATAYTSLVPFERHTDDFAVLRPLAKFGPAAGADATSNVMCLSCHRAHASAFDHMLRYDYGNEFMTVADAAGASVYPDPLTRPGQGRSVTVRQKAYYDRAPTAFAPQQRVLCNKCHAKD